MPDLPEGTEPNVATPGKPEGAPRYYTQEEHEAALEAARRQEKDKLYPTISKADERSKAMQDELKELRAFQKKQERTEQERQDAIEKERKAREEAELSAKELVERRQAEFAEQLATIQRENQQQLTLMEKEIEFNKLQAYIQTRVNQESENIAPELLDFIGGNTAEEVEVSIERVKAKTEQLVESMKAAGMRTRAAMPGVAPAAGTNGVGPMDQQGERQLSDADIKAMGMAEYAQLRQRMGIGGAQNQGLFRA